MNTAFQTKAKHRRYHYNEMIRTKEEGSWQQRMTTSVSDVCASYRGSPAHFQNVIGITYYQLSYIDVS